MIHLLQSSLNHRAVRLKRLNFSDSSFPESFEPIHIFFISDVGTKEVSLDILDDVRAHIDLIMIGGDFTKKGVPLSRVRKNLRSLKRLGAPIYFVWGDQDYEGEFHELDACLLEEGVNTLTNRAVNFESEQGDVISLIGFDNKKHRNVEVNEAFRHAKGSFFILATHDPSSYTDLDKSLQKQINVVLAGHDTNMKEMTNHEDVFVISKGYAAPRLSSIFRGKGECYIIRIQNG